MYNRGTRTRALHQAAHRREISRPWSCSFWADRLAWHGGRSTRTYEIILFVQKPSQIFGRFKGNQPG